MRNIKIVFRVFCSKIVSELLKFLEQFVSVTERIYNRENAIGRITNGASLWYYIAIK